MGSLRFLAVAGVAWCCVSTPVRAQVPSPLPAVPAPHAPPTRQECVALHEQAQDDKLAGKLLQAQSALRECSATACPSLISRDCVSWLAEVEQQMPSVIFRAAKDGEDVVALKVTEDARPLTETITGTPLELDPGPHHFVAELPGFPPQAATYVLQAGDKGRVIRFDFVTPPPPAAPAAPLPAVVPPPQLWRPIPKATYALGGATLAAALTGAVLGGFALSERAEVDGDCAPLCTASDVRSVKNLALAADISFALALLGAGATLYSYVARPGVPVDRSNATASLELKVELAGPGFVAGARF
ncbi:MAG TPA: hypothetical protein VHB79_28905 [Polyangiaceae bacterium]|nr:hypothetical protein [Polyangiaceae bacterium]